MTALGLDVGGSFLKLVVLDDANSLLRSEQLEIPDADVLSFVVEVTRKAMAEDGTDSVGLGLAGLVRHPDGEFVWGPHLRGTSLPYRAVLSELLGNEVAVDNDANLAAYAEWSLGAGERQDPMVMITLGTGIGMGLIIGGQVYRGASFAGEAGHMEITTEGELCSCGRRGCWETLVSGARLDRLAARLVESDPIGDVATAAGGAPPKGAHLAVAAAGGDRVALDAVAEVGHWLGRGIANLVLILDPARVVIGGAAAAMGEPLLEPARRVLAESMSGSGVRPEVPIVVARFGLLSGAVGAALAGREVQNGVHDR